MKYKKGDIVLVKSCAGDAIPDMHVKLIERIVRKPSKGRTMDWPGYAGWDATPVYQDEVDALRKEWSIPLYNPGEDIIFVYEDNIIKKPRKLRDPSKKKGKRRIVRKK
tara:strand:+ start:853 stop:1176 length:324 start_codon:yes stop_codon:yes gene_type:complete